MSEHVISRRACVQSLICAATAITCKPRPAAGDEVPRKPPKKIDVHIHMGVETETDKYRGLSPEHYVQWMDEHNIERACVLPLVSKEAGTFHRGPEEGFKAAQKYPDRFIPFCAVEPRDDRYKVGVKEVAKDLQRYKAMGAKGFGEHKVGLPFDHPRMMQVYEACQQVGLPLLFHMDNSRGWDRQASRPRLRKMLERFPKLSFIGHGPGWWATSEAVMDSLFETYPNIYGDLSAGSGARAIRRRGERAPQFLTRWADRLMFGTDYFHPGGQHVPQFEIYPKLDISDAVRHKVYRRTAIKVLRLQA